MSISFSLHSALSRDDTLQLISEAQDRSGEILRYFWISRIAEANEFNREADAEFGFEPKSIFVVQWNKERAELIGLVPAIFYEAFGENNILIRDDNFDLVPPP